MTFTELLEEVYTLTNRPDRIAETKLAVKQATLKAHQIDYFYKDISETAIQFTSAEYLQQLEYRSAVPRWRAVKYLRKYDATESTPGDQLELITPDEIFDSYRVQKEDVFYVAGEYLQIKSRTEEQYYLLGCYVNPNITEAAYDSWIASDHPYAIILPAAALVFKTIGYDEEAATYNQLASAEYELLKISNILANGY